MLNTFIKNKGTTKTIIHNNNKNYYNEIDWDADYDGEVAKISLNINDNGIDHNYMAEMDNDEISELLNIPSINMPIDKRLSNDFLGRNPRKMDESNMIIIYKKPPKSKKEEVSLLEPSNLLETIEQIVPEKYTHISSPLSSENLLFPLKIRGTKRRRRHHKSNRGTHRKHRTHNKKSKSHRIYQYSRKTF